MALPMMAASAKVATALTCSGVEIPKPTAMGIPDGWVNLRRRVTSSAASVAICCCVPVIVPLALWRAEREALLGRGEVGVWLGPSDDPDALAGDVALLGLGFAEMAARRAVDQAALRLGESVGEGALIKAALKELDQ